MRFWSSPLLIVMSQWKIIMRRIFSENPISGTSHIFTLSLGNLFHRGRIRLYNLFGVRTGVSIRINRVTRLGMFINWIIHTSFNSSRFIVYTLYIGWQLIFCCTLLSGLNCWFLLRCDPISHMHVLLKFHQLLHFSFAFNSCNMFPESNLQML